MTVKRIEGNANVSAVVRLDDYLWLIRQCQRLGLSKSAMVAKLIADARAQEKQEVPCPSSPSAN